MKRELRFEIEAGFVYCDECRQVESDSKIWPYCEFFGLLEGYGSTPSRRPECLAAEVKVGAAHELAEAVLKYCNDSVDNPGVYLAETIAPLAENVIKEVKE